MNTVPKRVVIQKLMSVAFLYITALCSFSCFVVFKPRSPTLCNPWTAACQAFLSFTISQSLFKLMSAESFMPFILFRPLLLLPSIFPSIGVSFNESTLQIRWLKYWSFSFSISPSNENSGLIFFRIDCHEKTYSHWDG